MYLTTMTMEDRLLAAKVAITNALADDEITVLGPMQVFRILLTKGAFSVIIVHNHTNENLEPSENDLDITDQMIQVGKFININVIDHLIINEYSFLSFKRRGFMEELEKSKKWIPLYILEHEAQKIGEKNGEKKGFRKGRREGKKKKV